MGTIRTPTQLVSLVRRLLRLPAEAEWVEDKENNADPTLIGEYISALSNSATLCGQDRSYLIWGIQDATRSIVGTSFDPQRAKVGSESLSNWLVRLLNPQVYFTFLEVFIDDCRVVVLEIEPASDRPVAFKGQEYVRVGSHKKKLKDHPERARLLWKTFLTTSFEDGVAAGDIEAAEALRLIDYPQYFHLMHMPLPEDRSGVLSALAADDLVAVTDSGLWSVTNLGAILFARDFGEFPALRRKAVRVIQYSGANRVVGAKEQVGVRGYASGFEGLINYVNSALPSNEVIGKALRTTAKMYPELAVRELVANALIHQNFSLTGTGPMVEIFDGRIEIADPGTPLVDPLRFVDSPPRSRNEKLASLMRRIGICEERGSGWDKVAFEIEFYQLPAPLVEVSGDHTRVTLFSHRDLGDMDRADRNRAIYLHACLRHVNQEKVTNTSIRQRFGIPDHNSAKASRLIKDALGAGMIVPRDPGAAPRFREYVPWWAVATDIDLEG